METLKTVIENPGLLLGFGDADYQVLAEELGALTPQQRAQALKQMQFRQQQMQQKRQQANQTGKGQSRRGTSREEFFKKLSLLTPQMSNDILKGVRRLVDWHIYSVKDAAKNLIKMFEDADNNSVGLNNLTGAILPKDSPFLLDSITLLSGTMPAAPNNQVGRIDFDLISAEIRNGVHRFYANDDNIIPDSTNQIFDTEYKQSQKGLYKLDNPILIASQKLIKLELELPVTPAAGTYVKTILSGSVVVSSKF